MKRSVFQRNTTNSVDNATTIGRKSRKSRKSKNYAQGLGNKANIYLDTHLFRRLNNIFAVWRFVISWMTLVLFLIGAVAMQTRALSRHYLELSPVEGGRYNEGLVGKFSTANPLFAANNVDTSVSKLIFSGLMTYSESNNLEPNLAQKITSDETGQNYTVEIKQNIKWHDGELLSADDVLFTYQTIQNPDTKSPLNVSWQGIIVEKINDYTVSFKLPEALSSFPHSLTNGIVPEHILRDVPVGALRTNIFSAQSPIGTGPFKWEVIVNGGANRDSFNQQIRLSANQDYFKGKPKLQGITIHAFSSDELIKKSFIAGEIDAMWSRTVPYTNELMSQTVAQNIYSTTGGVYLFLNNSKITDQNIRQALTYATPLGKVLSGLNYPIQRLDGPFLKEYFAYQKDITQLKYNVTEANRLLDLTGFMLPAGEKYRQKEGITLEINLTIENSTENVTIAEAIAEEWSLVGVKLNINPRNAADFEQTQLLTHNYDALLYGISLGADPDVYVYWHSSQAPVTSQTRLNLSEYRSTIADVALDAGRTRVDKALRSAKYKSFLEAWRIDAPAIGLYRPQYNYLQRTRVYNQDSHIVNIPTDRYSNVHDWMVQTVYAPVGN